MSQQQPKEDEEDDDEEQGEEFEFEDSADEERPPGDVEGVGPVGPVGPDETSGAGDGGKLPGTSPPAGQGGVPGGDVASVSTAGSASFPRTCAE